MVRFSLLLCLTTTLLLMGCQSTGGTSTNSQRDTKTYGGDLAKVVEVTMDALLRTGFSIQDSEQVTFNLVLLQAERLRSLGTGQPIAVATVEVRIESRPLGLSTVVFDLREPEQLGLTRSSVSHGSTFAGGDYHERFWNYLDNHLQEAQLEIVEQGESPASE